MKEQWNLTNKSTSFRVTTEVTKQKTSKNKHPQNQNKITKTKTKKNTKKPTTPKNTPQKNLKNHHKTKKQTQKTKKKPLMVSNRNSLGFKCYFKIQSSGYTCRYLGEEKTPHKEQELWHKTTDAKEKEVGMHTCRLQAIKVNFFLLSIWTAVSCTLFSVTVLAHIISPISSRTINF